MAVGASYDLACGYALLEKKEKALKQTDAAMELAQMILYGQQYKGQFIHFWLEDEDLESLRSDKKFEELAKKYAPKDFDWEKEREASEKRKKAREDAKKKQDEMDKDKKKGGGKDKGSP